MVYRMVWRIVLWLWFGLFGLFAANVAHAQCSTVSAAPAAFGSVTSFAVKNTQQSTSSSSAGIQCNGGLLSLFATNTINGTIASTNSSYLVGPTGDKIPYAIYADSAYQTQVQLGTTYNWDSTSFINLAGLLGGSTASIPLYLRTTTGATVAAGNYADTLTISWSWNICTGIGILGACLGSSTGTATATVPVTLTVTNDCLITAPNVNFGSAPLVGTFTPVTGSLSLVCTKGMTYTVGMTAGNNAASNGRRQMASGANRLQYDLYSSGVSTPWGDTGAARVSSTGTADGLTTQGYPYTATIYTDQTTPPAGSYTDTVTVDVSY